MSELEQQRTFFLPFFMVSDNNVAIYAFTPLIIWRWGIQSLRFSLQKLGIVLLLRSATQAFNVKLL